MLFGPSFTLAPIPKALNRIKNLVAEPSDPELCEIAIDQSGVRLDRQL
jgi:hypothetical protein